MRLPDVRLVTACVVALMTATSCTATGSTNAGVPTLASGDPNVSAVEVVVPGDDEAAPAVTDPATPVPTKTPATESPVGDGLFPTVIDVEATTSNGISWRFDVTLVSEYDSPSRYADAWRVLDADDTELGIRVLAHDHAGEQPFTRSTDVDIPADVATVFVEGRDQLHGWSGERFEVTLNR